MLTWYECHDELSTYHTSTGELRARFDAFFKAHNAPGMASFWETSINGVDVSEIEGYEEREVSSLPWHRQGSYIRVRKPLRQVPVADSLKDFLKLHKASPEGVFDFVQKRGPLGIFPLVEPVADPHGLRGGLCRHTESMFIYTRLARQARQILYGIGAVLGERVIQEKDLDECLLFCKQKGGPEWGRGRPAEIYSVLTYCIFVWRYMSTFKVEIKVPHARPHQRKGFVPALTPPLQAIVMFSGKGEGHIHTETQMGMEWNQWAATRYRAGAGIALVDREAPYSEVSRETSFPSPAQRPSPLFSALTFQLIQALTLPEGHAFCGECERLYNPYNPDKEGASKPRVDRPGFCSHECRGEYGRKDDHSRYSVRKGEAKPSH